MISAIVLAAGLSTRMGTLKQLLPYGERSVIEQVVSTLMTCSIDEIVVVLGHRETEIRAALANYPVQAAINPHYHEEMLTSIQTGWIAVSEKTDAVMHVLGDQPHLEAKVVEQLAIAHHADSTKILIPSFNHRRGHPILIPARFRDEICALAGMATMRDFMNAHAAEIQHLNVDTDTILRDMDTPTDYQREVAIYRSEHLV